MATPPQDNSGSNVGLINIVRRIFRRDALAPADSPKSAISVRSAVVRRLEDFFVEDLPASVDLLAIEGQELSGPAPAEAVEGSAGSAAEPAASQNHREAPSDLQAAGSVRPDAAEIASSEPIQPEIEKAGTVREKDAEGFGQIQELPSTAAVPESSSQQLQIDAAVAALSQRLDSEKQRFVVDIQQRLDEFRASGQAFVGNIQEQVAAAQRASLDSLIRVAVEKTRTELESLRQNAIEETQKQLASVSRASLESISKNLVEQVRAELDASGRNVIEKTQEQLVSIGRASLEPITRECDRLHAELANSNQMSMEDTRNRLAKLAQTSLENWRSLAATHSEEVKTELMDAYKAFIEEAQKQFVSVSQASLEPLVKTTVDQARSQLSHVTDEFLANTIPQIEGELRKLASKYSESPQPRNSYTRTSEAPPLTASPVPSPRSPLTSSVVTVPEGRMDPRDVWVELTSGVKFGLALGAVLLVALVIYFSSSPVVHLRAQPPTGFFDNSPSWNAQRRAREDQLAHAYWAIATRDVETKYGFGTALPPDPPESFKVEEKGPSGTIPKVDSEARTRYWAKLREVWPRSDSWEQTSNGVWDWVRNQTGQALNAVRSAMGL